MSEATTDFVQSNAIFFLRVRLCLAICTGLFPVTLALADGPPGDFTNSTTIEDVKQVFLDPTDDMALRRTDDDPTVDPLTGDWPELAYATLGRWAPTDAQADRYFGDYSTNGGFFRLDMVFCGLLNPPGEVNGTYTPTEYGPNPLFGWVELDMDANEDTGGETVEPELLYNGNVARWGGMPEGERFADRISSNGEPWNDNFDTRPAIHRSGLEFWLLFHGSYIYDIDYVDCNSNGVFEAGETWTMGGSCFWRARGYNPITYGLEYTPYIYIRFKHSIVDDATTVSFVYPLNNDAHAELYGETPESNDFYDGNANSVHETMWDLQLSAEDPPPSTEYHDYRPLLEQWEFQDPLDHLDPWDWRCTFLFGTSLDEQAQGGEVMAWTDTWPNVVVNDFNGDGLVTQTDRQLLDDYISAHDDEPGFDADGAVNGEIDRVEFSSKFSMYDDDYDGLVTTNGFPEQGPCDYDNDGDVDLEDYRAFQACYSTTPLDPEVLANVGCLDAFDDNGDLDVDLNDFAVFVSVLNGPG